MKKFTFRRIPARLQLLFKFDSFYSICLDCGTVEGKIELFTILLVCGMQRVDTFHFLFNAHNFWLGWIFARVVMMWVAGRSKNPFFDSFE